MKYNTTAHNNDRLNNMRDKTHSSLSEYREYTIYEYTEEAKMITKHLKINIDNV